MNNQSGSNVFDLFCLPSGHDQSAGGQSGVRWGGQGGEGQEGAEVAPKHES